MTKLLAFLLLVYLCYYCTSVFGVSIYSWTVTGRKYCHGNATSAQTDSLSKCDKSMREERKKLLEICLKDVMNYTLTDDKPRICSYAVNEDSFKVMDCMFKRTGEIYGEKFMASKTYEDFDAIDAVENDFEWCVMKVGSIYGFEHLCDSSKLNGKQLTDIDKCNTNAKDLIDLLNNCRIDAKLNASDKKPPVCDFYENIDVLKCWNNKSMKWHDSHENELWNRYIECLADIPR